MDKEIPYIAKIVNLADSFDAMTTDRPYKRRRPANEVIEDLQRNAGKQFAPELVTAFCRAMLKEITGETKQKKFRRSLGKDYMEAEGHRAASAKRAERHYADFFFDSG